MILLAQQPYTLVAPISLTETPFLPLLKSGIKPKFVRPLVFSDICLTSILHMLSLKNPIERKKQTGKTMTQTKIGAPSSRLVQHTPLLIRLPCLSQIYTLMCLLPACGGADYAKMVLCFFQSLVWPNPDGSHDTVTKSGITRHELAIAFILQTGMQFPCWIKPPNRSRARPHHYQDPKVLALPAKLRSLREQADALRIIIQCLQGFSSVPLYPNFHKTALNSLVQVGWGRTYTEGFPLRPEIANSDMPKKLCNFMPLILALNIRIIHLEWSP